MSNVTPTGSGDNRFWSVLYNLGTSANVVDRKVASDPFEFLEGENGSDGEFKEPENSTITTRVIDPKNVYKEKRYEKNDIATQFEKDLWRTVPGRQQFCLNGAPLTSENIESLLQAIPEADLRRLVTSNAQQGNVASVFEEHGLGHLKDTSLEFRINTVRGKETEGFVSVDKNGNCDEEIKQARGPEIITIFQGTNPQDGSRVGAIQKITFGPDGSQVIETKFSKEEQYPKLSP